MLPLPTQQTEGDEFHPNTLILTELNLPKGEQFYLMASYQRSKKQNIALIVSIVVYLSGFPAIICVECIITSILLTVSWLSSLLLFLYSFGVFDHSEQWLSYLLIISTNAINSNNNGLVDNTMYLFQESTKRNYALTAKLQNVQFNDINIIEDSIYWYSINISGVSFNEYGVTNKNAAIFVNDVINYLDETRDCDETKQTTKKGEYKKISKAKCAALGCDLCSFNLCSSFIMIWFIVTSIIFTAFGSMVYSHYCKSQIYAYDDIYDTKYNNEQYDDDECVDDVSKLLNALVVVWIVGIVVSIGGLFSLYHLNEPLFISVIIYAIIRAILFEIILVMVNETLFAVVIMIHSAEIAVLMKTFRIMKSSVTVSYLKNRLIEMGEMSKQGKGNEEEGIEIVLNQKSSSLS